MEISLNLNDIIKALEPHGYLVIKKESLDRLKNDFYLHKYKSYEEYKNIQIYHNKRKIDYIYADKLNLDIVAEEIKQAFPKEVIKGICHGSRNGFEQNYLSEKLSASVIGTDISDTANLFQNSIEWDFHNINEEWIGKNHFIYTNSLDQAFRPDIALSVWIDQLIVSGLLFIEHTLDHSVIGAGEMDPFGVKPQYMPYFIAELFGHSVSTKLIKSKKEKNDMDIWMFIIKKLYKNYGSSGFCVGRFCLIS